MKKKQIAVALVMALGMTMTYGVNGNCAVNNGWEESNGSWYYYKDGSMCVGWVQYGDKWYYMNPNGAMKTGWVSDGGKWYYMNTDGSMKTGWLNDGGCWYYMNADGSMKTGWLLENTTWYYLNSDGSMATGWYYRDSNGVMRKGVDVTYLFKKYYFDKNGRWIEDTSDSFRLQTTEDTFSTTSKSINFYIINRTDQNFKLLDRCYGIQRLREDGLWDEVTEIAKWDLSDNIVYAYSSKNYSIDLSSLGDTKLKPGKYKIYMYLGDRDYICYFNVKDIEATSEK